MTRYNFEQTVTLVNENDPNSQRLVESFKPVDSDKINECRMLIEKIRVEQAKLGAMFEYTSEDREHIAMLFGTREASFEQDSRVKQNSRELYREAQERQIELDKAKSIKWTEQAKIDLAELRAKRLIKEIEENQSIINEMNAEISNLKVKSLFLFSLTFFFQMI